MVRDTLLGFPSHALPYRYRKSYHFIDSLSKPMGENRSAVGVLEGDAVGFGLADDHGAGDGQTGEACAVLRPGDHT